MSMVFQNHQLFPFRDVCVIRFFEAHSAMSLKIFSLFSSMSISIFPSSSRSLLLSVTCSTVDWNADDSSSWYHTQFSQVLTFQRKNLHNLHWQFWLSFALPQNQKPLVRILKLESLPQISFAVLPDSSSSAWDTLSSSLPRVCKQRS